MCEWAKRFIGETRKSWFRSRPLFVRHATVSSVDLDSIEQEVRASLPADLREWLLEAGFGDLNEQLSFRREWFRPVEQGHLCGAVLFAQDDLGNFYAYVPANGNIIYFCRSSPEFKLREWVDGLPTAPYCWVA